MEPTNLKLTSEDKPHPQKTYKIIFMALNKDYYALMHKII